MKNRHRDMRLIQSMDFYEEIGIEVIENSTPSWSFPYPPKHGSSNETFLNVSPCHSNLWHKDDLDVDLLYEHTVFINTPLNMQHLG